MLPGGGSTIVTVEGYRDLRSPSDRGVDALRRLRHLQAERLVRNIDVQQKAQFLDNATAAADWLTLTAKLRVLPARPHGFPLPP